jgi:predicted PurR-regulated permease PerM
MQDDKSALADCDKEMRNVPISNVPISRTDIAAWLVAAVGLVLVIKLHLLSSLLAGLLVFKLVDVLTPWLRLRALGRDGQRVLAVTLIATIVIAALVGLGVGIATFLRNSEESVPLLMQRMAQIVEDARAILPEGFRKYIPADTATLQGTIAEWLRSNASALQLAGRGIGRTLVHVLMGMIIGALLSMQKAGNPIDRRPLTEEVARHAARMGTVFQRVVFAQVWISLINTFFTWLYLDIVLGLFGVELPLVKTLIALTFIVGLMPIIGNLISNTAIVIVCLSQGVPVALGSLVFLVVIHKLEYFLNARIIGSHIKARAWELLIAMLVMEAAFGIPGLIAAPIFYAYFKEALREKGLV